jgi:hypothetical protein
MQAGQFFEARAFSCPICWTNLELAKRADGNWALYHKELIGQEFCPNFGKFFELPLTTLKESSCTPSAPSAK